MARYTMGAGTQSGNGSSPITIADFLAMRERTARPRARRRCSGSRSASARLAC